MRDRLIVVALALALIFFLNELLKVRAPSEELLEPQQAPQLFSRIDERYELSRELMRTEEPVQVEGVATWVWLPTPGTPSSLFSIGEAAKYRPTAASLRSWMDQIPELAAVEFEWTEELEEAWSACRQQLALRRFVLEHQRREEARFLNREQSVSLEAELQSIRPFMDRHLAQDETLWRLINLYSDEVQVLLYVEGLGSAERDNVGSKWELMRSLTVAGSDSFVNVIGLLTGN